MKTMSLRLLAFIIIGLKKISIKLSNQFQSKTLMINWEQILDSWKTLKNFGFRARAIVSENHSAKVLTYKLLLKETVHLDDHSFIQHDYQQIYWLRDAVHLIKNVRNNLLSYKRFIFPALNTMVLKIQFYLKVVKPLGNYITMFWKR